MLRLLLVLAVLAPAACADKFDELRLKWRNTLTGGEGADSSLRQVRERLSSIESAARAAWSRMEKAPDRTTLWPESASATISSHVTSTWGRVRAMALAWATPGQGLYGDTALLADIRGAMEWLEQNRYSARVPKEYDNWWDWEIGTPLHVNDVLVLLYDRLTHEEIAKQAAAVDRFVSDPRMLRATSVSTGANRVWKCHCAAIRAIVIKDAEKLQLASDGLIPVFAYVTAGDGFYDDGSFIQHGRHPYTGGYGNALIGNMASLLYLLAGSPWDVRDAARNNLYRWVFESFQPLIYRGAMMDMVRGREISRAGSTDHASGHSTAAAILRVSQFAPNDLASRMKSMLKEWYLGDTSRDWAAGRSIEQIAAISRLLGDDRVPARGPLEGSWIFALMDRVVHHRPGWALGIAMHSSRIYNFESINRENLHAWHTGDGMTYLYTGDLEQFSDGFWATVDPQRLPGTTVVAGTTPRQSQTGGSNAAGGATLDGCSAVMMQLKPDESGLEAKKSWFLFDNEVVALGADIRGTAEGKPVETIVENRKIAGDPAFTVASDRSWAHLEGGLGYYFPNGAGWKHAREDRQGSWRDVNAGGSPATLTRRYHTIWFDHGAKPGGASYAYALLPERNRRQVEAYAAAPEFKIVENTPEAQAVSKPAAGLLAVNFWTGQPHSTAGIASDRLASVLAIERGGTLTVGVADPTQAETEVIHIELDRPAAATIQKEESITVEALSPRLRLSVNVSGARGRTRTAKFATP